MQLDYYPLDQINDVNRLLKAGKVPGRAVITPRHGAARENSDEAGPLDRLTPTVVEAVGMEMANVLTCWSQVGHQTR